VGEHINTPALVLLATSVLDFRLPLHFSLSVIKIITYNVNKCKVFLQLCQAKCKKVLPDKGLKIVGGWLC
jgi:hypothetical protein